GVGAHAGAHQHRRRGGSHAPDGPDPAVRVVRRLVAARHDGGRRLVAQCGANGAMRSEGADRDASEPLFIIAGGGTAGHVMPGLAVAQALIDSGHPKDRIHFIGARRGMEATMVPAAGFSVSLFDVRGIARSPTPSNLPAFYNLTAGIRRADRLFRRIEPSVVVSLGGYASVPAVVA